MHVGRGLELVACGCVDNRHFLWADPQQRHDVIARRLGNGDERLRVLGRAIYLPIVSSALIGEEGHLRELEERQVLYVGYSGKTPIPGRNEVRTVYQLGLWSQLQQFKAEGGLLEAVVGRGPHRHAPESPVAHYRLVVTAHLQDLDAAFRANL